MVGHFSGQGPGDRWHTRIRAGDEPGPGRWYGAKTGRGSRPEKSLVPTNIAQIVRCL